MSKCDVTGIILAAGNSTRFGKNINKNFEIINDNTVLSYSLNVFNLNDNIDNIIIVAREYDLDIINVIIDECNIQKPIKIVIGGDSRMKSVYNALISTDSKYVIVHDGARPLIKHEYINNCVKSLKKYKGVLIGVRTKDTVKIVDDNMEVLSSTERIHTWIGQTPQGFDRNLLLKLHKKYSECLEITDDCMLLERDGYKVKLIEGSYTNIKITTYDDVDIVRSYLK